MEGFQKDDKFNFGLRRAALNVSKQFRLLAVSNALILITLALFIEVFNEVLNLIGFLHIGYGL